MPRHPSIEGVRRCLAIAVMLVAFCLGLVACGGDEESQAEAEQHLCASLDNFAASIVSLQGLGLQTASEDDLSSAADNVDEAWDQVVEDAKDVKNANTDAIESAYDDLKNAIEDRPTDKPITEVLAGLEPKVRAFAQAWKDLAGSFDCKAAS
jgi:hypothetical protein